MCIATTAAQIPEMTRACKEIVLKNIVFPASIYKAALSLDLRPGTTVIFEGETVFTPAAFLNPQIQSTGGSPPSWFLAEITGSNVIIKGAPGSTIHGNGQAYWDGAGGNKGRIVNKPKFFRFNLKASTVSNLNVINTPQHTFSIHSSNSTFDRISLNNKAGDAPCKRSGISTKGSCGHNTDAFNVGGSSTVTISNANIWNQDDCLALNSGENIRFTSGVCHGGHGISIGSIKTGNSVRNVLISDSRISASENGIRIKTYDDATNAEVVNVVYRNIVLDGITRYGIDVQQDYRNEGPTGKAGNGVKIANLTLDGVSGTVRSGGQGVYVNCGMGSCTNWSWKGVSIKNNGGLGKACHNPPAVAALLCR